MQGPSHEAYAGRGGWDDLAERQNGTQSADHSWDTAGIGQGITDKIKAHPRHEQTRDALLPQSGSSSHLSTLGAGQKSQQNSQPPSGQQTPGWETTSTHPVDSK